MSRETLWCVFQVLSLEFYWNWSTFLGLPEGQNMVTLYGGTTVNRGSLQDNKPSKYIRVKACCPADFLY